MRPKKTSSLLKISLSVAFLILTFGLSASYAEFYVIAAGGKKIGTEITSLPYTISSSGFYFISKDLSCPAGNHGITITASNVTLDLMGFALVGPDAGLDYQHGIHINSIYTNVEVRNGTIRDFGGRGIMARVAGSEGYRLISLRVINNAQHGIDVLGGTHHLIKDCICSRNGENGILSGNGSTITGNTCFRNGGDSINAGRGSTITGNTCYDNEDDGISAGLGSTVIGNTFRDNTDHGIYLYGDSYVGQNTCTDNGTNMNDCSASNPCAKGLNYAP